MRRTLLAAVSTLALATSAHAGQGEHIGLYAGQFEIFDGGGSGMFGADYRFKDQFNGLRPTVGLFATTDGALYAYGGAYWDLPLNTAPFVITPGLAVGGYHSGSDKDLGHGIEFRSTLEISYEMNGGDRLGVAISHLSNASIGDSNPGVETLQLVYQYPMW